MSANQKSPETRWQRFMRSFLYGLNVDRNVKAKARLAMRFLVLKMSEYERLRIEIEQIRREAEGPRPE